MMRLHCRLMKWGAEHLQLQKKDSWREARPKLTLPQLQKRGFMAGNSTYADFLASVYFRWLNLLLQNFEDIKSIETQTQNADGPPESTFWSRFYSKKNRYYVVNYFRISCTTSSVTIDCIVTVFFFPTKKNFSFNSGSEMHRFEFCSQRSRTKIHKSSLFTLKKRTCIMPSRVSSWKEGCLASHIIYLYEIQNYRYIIPLLRSESLYWSNKKRSRSEKLCGTFGCAQPRTTHSVGENNREWNKDTWLQTQWHHWATRTCYTVALVHNDVW